MVSAATARPAETSTAAPSTPTDAMSAKRFVAEAAAACLLLAVLLVVFG